MVITKRIREVLDTTPPGRMLTIADFGVPQKDYAALVKALSRMVAG